MLARIDQAIIKFLRTVHRPFSRAAIFIVFFWFGILKVLGTSPANPLVADLLHRTLPFVTFDQFIIVFGFFEMLIGIIFLIPGLERVAILFLAMHMVTTFMPLVLLPSVTWQAWWVPTLEGQYIIKNLAIIAVAIGLAVDLEPWQGGKEYS